MISSFLTIVIPSKNSFPKLVETLSNIIGQTRIRGTKVIITDFGSSDGSLEYAHQESFQFSSNISIFPKSFKEGKETYHHEISQMVETPYILFISPGSILTSKDSIMNLVNGLSTSKKNFIVGTKKNKNQIADFFDNIKSLVKPNTEFELILCRTKMLDSIKIDDDLRFYLNSDEYSSLRLLSI